MLVSIVAFFYDEDGELLERLEFITSDPAELRQSWARLRDGKFSGPIQLFTVNRTFSTPKPWQFDLTDGRTWCPYCRAGREFWEDKEYEVWRCPVCAISSSDYYVRRCNEWFGMYQSPAQRASQRKNSTGSSSKGTSEQSKTGPEAFGHGD